MVVLAVRTAARWQLFVCPGTLSAGGGLCAGWTLIDAPGI
jgi:hypothetical protein